MELSELRLLYCVMVDYYGMNFLDDITDREIVRFLTENCDNYGELHDVLVPAKREADITCEPLTVDFIKTVLNLR